MMLALFDTNILIDNIKANPDAAKELARYPIPFISRIVWIELLSGARASDSVLTESYLQTFRVLELTPDVATRTVAVRQQHRRLKLPDAIIYATAQVHGLTLITRNTRDFDERMPGVRIPYTV